MGKIFINKLKGGSIIIKKSGWTPPVIPSDNSLCFTAQQANSTVLLGGDWSSSRDPYGSDPYGGGNTIPKLEYKLEGSTNKDWARYTGQTITLANVNDKMYMRATSEGNRTISTSSNIYQFTMTGEIAASGNIQTLLDQTGNKMDVPQNCYQLMFYNCTSLTQAPELPATTLANHCYYCMFQDCSSLTQAPKLPATELAERCYSHMFYNCPKFSTVIMKSSMNGVYNTSTHGNLYKTVEYVL